MPNIYDNIEANLKEGLNKTIKNASRADFCIGYFNMRGWNELADQVDQLAGDVVVDQNGNEEKFFARVLIGMQKAPKDFLLKKYSGTDKTVTNTVAKQQQLEMARELRKQLVLGLPNNNDEAILQRLLKQLKDRKVVVKLHNKYQLHAKLYLIYRDDSVTPKVGYLGSSNLTFAGLSRQGELNIDVVEQDAAQKLEKWFNDRWEDRFSIDITDDLITVLEESWATDKEIPPYYIYLKTAYHLAQEARAGLSEFSIPAPFDDILFPYQASAVQIAARYLNQRGGVIIGDVVGLGKTYTALALAKLMEEEHVTSTLIICPKNLVDMWQSHVDEHRLYAKVFPISIIQSKLSELRAYGNIIIDESHNFRNRDGKRYKILHEYLHRVPCRVILLSATPYNKSYLDLANQIRLFIGDDQDLGIYPEKCVEQIGGIARFRSLYQKDVYTIGAYEKSTYSEDWRELMRYFLVRRTRSFIKDVYAKTDENGKKYLPFKDNKKQYFPDRIPKKVDFTFNINDKDDQYAKLYSQDVVDIIDDMRFPRYGLGQEDYRLKNPKVKISSIEEAILDDLNRAGIRLKGFARTNLFKRLESSGYAFLLSVSRQLLRNYLFLNAIDTGNDLPVGRQETNIIDDFIYTDNDIDEGPATMLLTVADYTKKAKEFYDELKVKYGNIYNWVNSAVFSKKLRADLENDNKMLHKILNINSEWDIDKDRKLKALDKLCNEEHKNKKVLIFTQYSDTAEYVYQYMKPLTDNVEVVTGDTDNPTDSAKRFSPVSNNNYKIPEAKKEIRVLITTDVLSEGQNLQDANIIVNFDLPWAIIRLIQRAGRVDRIGQKAEKIYCYSFLPENGIEEIINLRGRLQERILQNAETMGADETFFDGDPVNIRDLYNEKAGMLDDSDDQDIDLPSYALEIWNRAVKKNPKLKDIVPNLQDVIYTAKKGAGKTADSVIVYSRNSRGNDVLTWIDEHGVIKSQSQHKILLELECEPEEPALPRTEKHHDLVKKAIEVGNQYKDSIGGSLSGDSVVKQIYYKMLEYIDLNNESTLFYSADLKLAVQDIHRYTLKEQAKAKIRERMKRKAGNEELAQLVLTLWKDNNLCNKHSDNSNIQDINIICSMGIVNNE